MAASSHLTPSWGNLDGVSRYNPSLDCLIRPCAVFVALRAYKTARGCITRPRLGKDGSGPYSTRYRHFFAASIPAAEPLINTSSCPDKPVIQGFVGILARSMLAGICALLSFVIIGILGICALGLLSTMAPSPYRGF